MADGRGRVPANDNPLWPWGGICTACGADMGPVRDSRECLDCLHGEQITTTAAPDPLWTVVLEPAATTPVVDPDLPAKAPRW
jgi:hypothetical protein